MKLHPLEWFLCVVWTLAWGSIAYIAFTERKLTLGAARVGGGHFEGVAAIAVGFVALGAAAGGIWWLLRVSRYRRFLRATLVAGWIAAVAGWLVFGG